MKSIIITFLLCQIAVGAMLAQSDTTQSKSKKYELLPVSLLEPVDQQNSIEKYLDLLTRKAFQIKYLQTDNIMSEQINILYSNLKNCFDKKLANETVQKEIKGLALQMEEFILAYNQRAADPTGEVYKKQMAIYLYNTADSFFHRNQYDQAIAYLDKSKNYDSDFLETTYLYGVVTYFKSDYTGAISYMNEYLSKGGASINATYYRGCAYYFLNDYSNAISDITIYLSTMFDAEAYFLLARSKTMVGDIIGANKDYEVLLKKEKEYETNFFKKTAVYNNIAYNLVRLKQFKEALPYVNKALKMDGKNRSYWDTRGEIYYGLGQYKQCIKDMTNALNYSIGQSALGNSYYFRGMAKLKLGNSKEGMNDIQKAAALGKKEANEIVNGDTSMTKPMPQPAN